MSLIQSTDTNVPDAAKSYDSNNDCLNYKNIADELPDKPHFQPQCEIQGRDLDGPKKL